MGRNNKYNNFPPRIQVPVGGVCSLCQCNRQVRKAATKILKAPAKIVRGFPSVFPMTRIKPGMVFEGVNNLTGENEAFRVESVPIYNPERACVTRIR